MRPLIVGIAGGSGSGKTHLANQIVKELGPEKVSCVGMDQYFRTTSDQPLKPSAINFDHPAHLDFDAMMKGVERLRDNQSISVPAYDFLTMTRTEDAAQVHPTPIIVLEGLFVLADPMVSLCDLTCFLDVAADERLLGRILRDTRERGVSIEEVIDRYQRFVRPSYQVFVAPTKQNADVVLNFTYRRAFFSKMLIEVLRGYVAQDESIEAFVSKLRTESYLPSIRAEDGFMSMTTDIFELSKAYPEKAKLREVEQPLSSPAAASLGRMGSRKKS